MVEFKKDVPFRLGRGFIEGAGVDQIMYALTAYIPQLAEPSPIPIPGYAPAGTHWDDIITLGISAVVVSLGAYKRDTGLLAEGVGMIAGNFISSQFQQIAPIPPWSAGVRTVKSSIRYDLVQID